MFSNTWGSILASSFHWVMKGWCERPYRVCTASRDIVEGVSRTPLVDRRLLAELLEGFVPEDRAEAHPPEHERRGDEAETAEEVDNEAHHRPPIVRSPRSQRLTSLRLPRRSRR